MQLLLFEITEVKYIELTDSVIIIMEFNRSRKARQLQTQTRSDRPVKTKKETTKKVQKQTKLNKRFQKTVEMVMLAKTQTVLGE